MGDLIQFPAHRIVRRQPVSKKQLASIWARSPRYIELAMRDSGLPYWRDPRGRALFDLEEVEAWRAKREAS